MHMFSQVKRRLLCIIVKPALLFEVTLRVSADLWTCCVAVDVKLTWGFFHFCRRGCWLQLWLERNSLVLENIVDRIINISFSHKVILPSISRVWLTFWIKITSCLRRWLFFVLWVEAFHPYRLNCWNLILRLVYSNGVEYLILEYAALGLYWRRLTCWQHWWTSIKSMRHYIF